MPLLKGELPAALLLGLCSPAKGVLPSCGAPHLRMPFLHQTYWREAYLRSLPLTT